MRLFFAILSSGLAVEAKEACKLRALIKEHLHRFTANDDDSADSDSHDEEEEDDEVEPNGLIIESSDPRGDYDNNPMPMLTNND